MRRVPHCYTPFTFTLVTKGNKWRKIAAAMRPSATSTVAACCGGGAGLIFVIDSADQGRIKEAQHELENVVTSDEMRGVPVEIVANKQDMPGISPLLVHL